MNDQLIFPDPRPTRADALKNRALLLETAQRLFTERGVDAVTMSDVAEAAGVGKGTLYRHFANKVELCQVLIDQDQRDLQNRTLTRLRERGEPLDNLEWFLGEVVAFILRNEEILFTEISSDMMLAHPAHTWWRQTIRGLLTQIAPDLDIEYTTDMLFVMLEPRTIRFQISVRSYTHERLIRSLTAVVRRLVSKTD